MNRTQLATYSLIGFYIVAIANLFEQVMKTGWLDLATKPFLMILLLTFYLTSRKPESNLLSRLMVAALVFSWFGDIILMLQDKMEGLFIFGLAAFLIAHVFYIFAYRKARFHEPGESSKSFVRTRFVFLVFIGGTLIYMLYPTLEEMLIPVILYTVVIITMGIFALLRRGWTVDKSFLMVYGGALLFIMSDAMIGIDKFMNPIVQARLLIMATYISAQYLIVRGIVVHENAEEAERTTGS